MLRRILLLMIFGMFFFGCSDELTFSDNEMDIEKVSAENPHLNGKVVTKPFKVESSGVFIAEPDPERCGEFPLFIARGEGLATLIGKFDVDISYCYDPVNEQVLSDIRAVQVAANGDELYSVVTGAEEIPGTNSQYQTYTYYGGTGRFEGVVGEIVLFVTTYPEMNAWTAEGGGELTY